VAKTKELLMGWVNNPDNVIKRNIEDLFGIKAGSFILETLAIKTNLPIDSKYHFDKVLLKKILRWIYGSSSRNNILLFGDAGVGKTSLIIEVCARLNIPLYQIACSGKTRFQHLVGSRELVGGQTVWVDGPLARAMREGGVFLMDEATRMDPGEQMNLAAVLDSRSSLTIPDTGEVVKPHPRFRVAATGNSAGFGDESGAYIGEKPSSFAFLDRFQKYQVPFLPEEVERQMIAENAPTLPQEFIEIMIKTANEIRKGFIGAGGGLVFTLSPRSLMVWAMEAVSYVDMGIDEPIWESLMDTVMNGAPTDNIKTVKELYTQWVA